MWAGGGGGDFSTVPVGLEGWSRRGLVLKGAGKEEGWYRRGLEKERAGTEGGWKRRGLEKETTTSLRAGGY